MSSYIKHAIKDSHIHIHRGQVINFKKNRITAEMFGCSL